MTISASAGVPVRSAFGSGENGFPKALDGDVQADFHLHFSSFLRFRILATEGRFTRIAPLGQNS